MSKNNEFRKLSTFEQLMRAIKDHDVDSAKRLISVMEPVEFNETDNYNPLHQAAFYEELGLLKLLIEKAEDSAINSCGINGTPLYLLIENNASKAETAGLCELLFNKMTQETINKQMGYFRHTVLHKAAYHKHNLEISKVILQESPDIINIKDRNGRTALDLVVKHHDISFIDYNDNLNQEIAKLLCEHGGVFNKEEEVSEHFKPWLEPIKMVDKLFNQEQPEAPMKKVAPELYQMLINRFEFKLIYKFGQSPNSEELNNYKSYIHSLCQSLPEEFHNELMITMDKVEVGTDQLDSNKSQSINIAGVEDKDINLIPFQQIQESNDESNISDAHNGTNSGVELPVDFINKLKEFIQQYNFDEESKVEEQTAQGDIITLNHEEISQNNDLLVNSDNSGKLTDYNEQEVSITGDHQLDDA